MPEIIVTKIRDLNRRDIEAMLGFLDRCPTSSAYQFPFPELDEDYMFQVVREGQIIFLGRASKGYFASRFISFFRTLSFNRGPVALTGNDFMQGIRLIVNWAKANGIVRVDMNPDYSGDDAVILEQMLAQLGWRTSTAHKRFTLRTGVGHPDDEILNGFSKSARYQVRRAAREGIYTIQGEGQEHVNLFAGLHAEMTKRKGLAQSDGRLFHALWQLKSIDADRLSIILAYHGNVLLGGNIYFKNGSRVEYLFGAVSKNSAVLHGDVSAGYPLQFAGMKWARGVGATEYDFGGFSPNAKTGPAYMKKSCVADPIPLELAPGFTLTLRIGVGRTVDMLHGIHKAIRKWR